MKNVVKRCLTAVANGLNVRQVETSCDSREKKKRIKNRAFQRKAIVHESKSVDFFSRKETGFWEMFC
ncbi:MAG: hypothetical protein A2007_02380 [Verrucomicrobia bacterium GWC2_42_7]|nr:MAG: hypothetical protein A2007_02380 [Verrucomicrobia bacterium GWC2_42_7]